MAQSQKDQIFEQLQQIQTENSELHERIAKLKAQRHLANEEDQEKPDNNQSQEYAIEIEKLKEQLNQEEANIVELKKNLNTLLSNQQTIQSKIDEENNQVFQELTPKLKKEEEETTKFYDELINLCSDCGGVDIEALKNLVHEVQEKRKSVTQKTEEHQKILRLIAFNKSQTNSSASTTTPESDNSQEKTKRSLLPKQPAKFPPAGAPNDNKRDKKRVSMGQGQQPPNAPNQDRFDNPLPCFQLSAPQLKGGAARRRTSLAGKHKK